jgi:hypothetical protein
MYTVRVEVVTAARTSVSHDSNHCLRHAQPDICCFKPTVTGYSIPIFIVNFNVLLQNGLKRRSAEINETYIPWLYVGFNIATVWGN